MKKSKVISLPNILVNTCLISMSRKIENLEKNQKRFSEEAVRSILKALDCKDHYTFNHSTRVAYYSVTLGREIGFSDEEIYELEMAALFHDIGKIATPDSVLLKPERLTEEEFLIMKKHPEMTAEILEGFEPFEKVALYAKHHHERYDGKGYPSGLKGEKIPVQSRIILIADTFDAMTSSRPYRKGLSYEIAFEELREFSGTQFDPFLAAKFIMAMRRDEQSPEKTFSLRIVDGTFDKKAA